MAGGGGGGTFSGRSPEDVARALRSAFSQADDAGFKVQLAGFLSELLQRFNTRDKDTVSARLAEISQVLAGRLDGRFDQFFGGSVAKHTYVDGMSDIDSMLVLNDSELEGRPPSQVLDRLVRFLSGRIPSTTVTAGRMAVTVDYADGMSVQLLPTLKVDDRLMVPSSRRDDWSKINPQAFRNALTERNAECDGRLIPTIKLAKAINSQLPEAFRASGYHMESLGIAAFKGYAGRQTTSEMLPHFFSTAKTLVLSPIKDSTGQSVHVDEYLGPANSEVRQGMSHLFDRVSKRMSNGSAAGSLETWQSLFGLGY